MNRRLLRLPEVKSHTGLSRSAIYDRMAAGTFPNSIPIGGRLIAWDSADIEKWIADRIAESKQS